jgi:uncharacterized protein YqeY
MSPESDLEKKLAEDMKQAMKSGDTLKRDTLRMLIASVKNAWMAKQADLTDADVLGVISKEVKRRQESIDAFKKGNRDDLVIKL